MAWRLDVDIYEGDELDDDIGAQEEEELDSSDSESKEESIEYSQFGGTYCIRMYLIMVKASDY
jgi:hypothetical protein